MAERLPLPLALYRAAARAATGLFHLLFALRSRSGKEIAARKGERFGRTALPRPKGHLVWIHAASVGETMSVLPLIDALAARGSKVLLTTVTVTASQVAEKRLPEGCIHQFIPYDAPGPIGRFLDHWSPDLAMVVESEIWPCLFMDLRSRAIPFVLVNGRLSDGSSRTWSRVPRIARHVFECPDAVLAQSDADAERFRRLGCRNVQMTGNVKFDAAEPPVREEDLAVFRKEIGSRPVWLAALTHPGEDEVVLDAFETLRHDLPDLLLIIVPRHPARAGDVRDMAVGRDYSVASRKNQQRVSEEIDIYLGDTLGEMGLFYRSAPVTFLGGSLVDVGGHNPVEAALLGSALVTGPKVSNARAVYKDFWSHGAALRIEEAGDLADRVLTLFRVPGRAEAQAETARKLVEAGRGALEKTLDMLQPHLNGNSRDTEAERRHEQGT